MNIATPTPTGCELLNVLFSEALQRYDLQIGEVRDNIQDMLNAVEVDASAVSAATNKLATLKNLQRSLYGIRDKMLYKGDKYQLANIISELLYCDLGDISSLSYYKGESTVAEEPAPQQPVEADLFSAVKDIAKAMRTVAKASTPDPVDAVLKTLADELSNTYEETFGEPYPGGADALNNLSTLMTQTHAAIVKRMIGINA